MAKTVTEEESAAIEGGGPQGGSPPYIPFKTFLNLVLRMEDGAPPQLDRSYLSGQAGGLHQPIIAAFKYFGLIGQDNEVKPELEALAASGDKMPERVGELVKRRYAWINLGSNATQQMLDEKFREPGGLTGSTLRKAVTFYLHAMSYAGLPLSRFYKVPRGVSQNGSPAPRPRRKSAGRKNPPAPPRPDDSPATTQSADEFTVKLQAGGSVTLKVNVGHFALSRNKKDRDFVQGLMDALTSYEEGRSDASEDGGGVMPMKT